MNVFFFFSRPVVINFFFRLEQNLVDLLLRLSISSIGFEADKSSPINFNCPPEKFASSPNCILILHMFSTDERDIVFIEATVDNLNGSTSLHVSNSSSPSGPDRNVREHSKTLLALVRGNQEPSFVRILTFGAHMNRIQFDEKLKILQSVLRRWLGRYGTIPNVLLPSLFQTRLVSDGGIGQLILAGPRIPNINIKNYFETWLQMNRNVSRAQKELALGYIIREIIKQLNSLHEAGLVHGSVKCSNVVVDRLDDDSPIQLHLIDAGLHDLEEAVGSLKLLRTNYLPPPESVESPVAAEHHGGGGIPSGYLTAAADIWSLGVLIIDLVDGAPPPVRRPMSNIIPPATTPMLKAGAWSATFKAFQVQCCHCDPNERPSALDLLKFPFLNHASAFTCLNDALYGDSDSFSNSRDGSPLAVPPAGVEGAETVFLSNGAEVQALAGTGTDFMRLVVQPTPRDDRAEDQDQQPAAKPAQDEADSGEDDLFGEGRKSEQPDRGTLPPDLLALVVYQALDDLIKDADYQGKDLEAISQLKAAVTRLDCVDPTLGNEWVLQILEGLASPDIDAELRDQTAQLRAEVHSIDTSSPTANAQQPLAALPTGPAPLCRADFNSYVFGKWMACAADGLHKSTIVSGSQATLPGLPYGAGLTGGSVGLLQIPSGASRTRIFS
jgi:hypothetical protein